MHRRKAYGGMMEQCGHKVNYLKVKDKHKKNSISFSYLENKFDLIWFQNISYVRNNGKFIDSARSMGVPIVVYYTFNPQESYKDYGWIKVWKRIDYFFVHNKIFCEFLKGVGVNAHYMPLGFYTNQYFKVFTDKVFDVSFCGTDLKREDKNVDKRAIYIRALKKYNIVVYGQGFKGKVGKISVSSYKTHKKQRNVYSKTKINLDLPFFCTPDKIYQEGNSRYHIKNRFFEVPATGGFLLTVRCPEFLDIFDEDTVGYYDDNIESLRESVARYLKDDSLRKKMSKRAYKLVHDKHTYLHRFKKMFKIIG